MRTPILAATLALAVAAPVLAQPAVSEVIVRAPAARGDLAVKTQVVSWADLDIGDEAGVETLLGRIRHAADQVCSPAPDSKELSQLQDYDRCRGEAMHEAIAQVPSDALEPVYDRVG